MITNPRRTAGSSSPPITRPSLLWLFTVQLLVLAPHFLTVPMWIGVIWLGVCFWRWKIFQGAWNYPSKLHKTLVVLISSAGLVASVGAHFSLLAMVSLLLVGSSLKLLEIKTRKDFVLLVFIAFFVLATQFIFYTQFVTGLYGVVCLLVLCAALMQLYRPSIPSFWLNLRATFYILLQAIPVMLLLFIVMPRLGAFWAMPAPQQAKTGMSDSMAPGDITNLAQSEELVFRATFSEVIPTPEKLYWRSLVLSHFDGRRWSVSPAARYELQPSLQAVPSWMEAIDSIDELSTYNIVAEPSGQRWLFSLGAPQQWGQGLLIGRDLHLQAERSLTRRLNYQVTSALKYQLDKTLQEKDYQQNLQLPPTVNPETRRVAREWLAETGSNEQLIKKLFSHYRNHFVYTLQPPTLGVNSVDDFLWGSQQGFCEHYASSFVFFMRAAGIPARVVVGYQGGELNTVKQYLSIHQRDAHAWAEVWLNERGWVVYDPTAAVAPERIRRGIAASLNSADQQLLVMPFGGSYGLLRLLHQQWDALNFQWARWVMNYDAGLQSSLLTKILGNIDPWRVVALILIVGIGSSAVIFLVLYFSGRSKSRAAHEHSALAYRQLQKKLQRAGYSLEPGETPRQFIQRVIKARPDLGADLAHISRLFEAATYDEDLLLRKELDEKIACLSLERRR